LRDSALRDSSDGVPGGDQERPAEMLRSWRSSALLDLAHPAEAHPFDAGESEDRNHCM
jgi:hypothetical protein